MNVEVLSVTTDKPLSLIGTVAGTSYGKSDTSIDRAKRCFNAGHLSVFEHVNVTWRIEGISRACSHQLVRHRLASYCQKSQRYTKLDKEATRWYALPLGLVEKAVPDAIAEYKVFMEQALEQYLRLLDMGIAAEDARYVLPEATCTDISMTMNLREFINFYKLRSDKSAQREIRDLSSILLGHLRSISDEFKEFVEMLCESVEKDYVCIDL